MLAAALEDEEAEDEIPPPARHDGRIIRFDRYVPTADFPGAAVLC